MPGYVSGTELLNYPFRLDDEAFGGTPYEREVEIRDFVNGELIDVSSWALRLTYAPGVRRRDLVTYRDNVVLTVTPQIVDGAGGLIAFGLTGAQTRSLSEDHESLVFALQYQEVAGAGEWRPLIEGTLFLSLEII
jgi:hypothetical protein